MFDWEFIWISLLLPQIGAQAIRSRSAQVTVLVPPENPKIVKDGNMSIDEIVATEDREIELECISSGGKPAAEVSIFLNKQEPKPLEMRKKESFVCEDFPSVCFSRTYQIPLSLILFPIHLFCEMPFPIPLLLDFLTLSSFFYKTNGIFFFFFAVEEMFKY